MLSLQPLGVAKRPKAAHQLTSAQFDALFLVGDEDA